MTGAGRAWALHGGLVLAGLTLLGVSWFGTLAHLASLLWHIDIYSYGVLVPVISGWLIWQDMPVLRALQPRLYLPGAVVLGAASLLWLAGEALDMALVAHIALVGAVQGIVLLVLGRGVYRHILFPMLFLFACVPFGDGLVVPLQLLTAKGVIFLLSLTPVAFSHDGVVLSLPSGSFIIAAACAGARFFLTASVVGVLLCRLAFRSWKRRGLMLLCAVTVPVTANVLRVFTILLIAEFTGADFAKTVDHVIYGWVFLSIVLLLLIAIAYRFSDRPTETITPIPEEAVQPASMPYRLAAIAVLVLPLAVRAALAPEPTAPQFCDNDILEPPVCVACGFRALAAPYAGDGPAFDGADSERRALYRKDGTRIMVYAARFSPERPGHKLMSGYRRLASRDWRQDPRTTPVADAPSGLPFYQATLRRDDVSRVAWQLYLVNGRPVKPGFDAKLHTALARLRDGKAVTAALIVSVENFAAQEDASATLGKFLSTFPPSSFLWTDSVSEDNESLCAASVE